MKRIMSIVCALALVTVVGTACDSGEKEFETVDIPFTEYSLDKMLFNVNTQDILNNGAAVIIDSDEELRNYVEGDYAPVDFSKKTLLLAGGRTSTAIHSFGIGNFQKISTNKYLLKVELEMTVATTPDVWIIGLVADKLSENSEVILNVIDI